VLNAVQRAGRVAAPRRESLQNQERRRNHNQLDSPDMAILYICCLWDGCEMGIRGEAVMTLMLS